MDYESINNYELNYYSGELLKEKTSSGIEVYQVIRGSGVELTTTSKEKAIKLYKKHLNAAIKKTKQDLELLLKF